MVFIGSLASAVITWRNSLVFHDSDKVTSLYIHIYPPLVFTIIRFVALSHLCTYDLLKRPTPHQALLPKRRRTLPSGFQHVPSRGLAPHQRWHLWVSLFLMGFTPRLIFRLVLDRCHLARSILEVRLSRPAGEG